MGRVARVGLQPTTARSTANDVASNGDAGRSRRADTRGSGAHDSGDRRRRRGTLCRRFARDHIYGDLLHAHGITLPCSDSILLVGHLQILLAFGITFELPVVVVILTSLGLVSPAFLRAKRRHAFVVITILAAVLSPGDFGPVTLLLFGPLILLYEVSIVLSTLMVRKRTGGARDADLTPENSVPLLFVLGMATARWKNRRGANVLVEKAMGS